MASISSWMRPFEAQNCRLSASRPSPNVVRGLVGENAAKLYGLDLSKATVKAKLPIGSEKVAA